MQGWSSQELKLWGQGCKCIAGVDEAGRGPLAGPVVAAVVILPQDFEANGVNDSKLLTETQREEIAGRIKVEAIAWAVAVISHARIDRINILQATFTAMRRAVSRLAVTPDHLLVDGNMVVPSLTIPQTAVVRGDAKVVHIACASILAKVHRDHLMYRLDRRYPQYHFAKHKGYPTQEHRQLILVHGISPIHRRSFTLLPAQKELNFGESAHARKEV